MPQLLVEITTSGPGLYEFTGQAADFVARHAPSEGLLTLFVRHTSCSLLIQENADPDVQTDIRQFFARLAPSADDPAMEWIVHRAEGPDDMPAHLRAALTSVSLSVPVAQGRLLLGTWQGIYLFEHRNHPHRRQVVMHLSQ